MRILHVINHMGMGGAQSLLSELAPIQKKNGHEVCVLELFSTLDRGLVKKMEEQGVRVMTVSSKRSVRNPLNIFSVMPYLGKYDIVHVHLFPSNYWVALAKLLTLSKTPIVTTEHSTDNKRRKIPLFKYIDSFIYRCYNEVVACADKALETFKARFPGVRCTSIPNGVDISKYKNAKPYSKRDLIGVSGDCFVTTMVARFDYPKRQDTLVEAISMLPDKFHLVLVGGDENDGKLKNVRDLASKLHVDQRVHFLYTRPDVPRILKTSDVVVMSSEYEGLSLSSIEGMACGRPFLATNVKGLKEVVAGAGELFECGNAEELADLIMKLATDNEYYKSVVEKCILRSENYSIDVVSERYQQEYNKFIL